MQTEAHFSFSVLTKGTASGHQKTAAEAEDAASNGVTPEKYVDQTKNESSSSSNSRC